MGKKLNGKVFRVNGKPFRVNGELFLVRGKVLHIEYSSCEGSYIGSIGMFGWLFAVFFSENGGRRDAYLLGVLEMEGGALIG